MCDGLQVSVFMISLYVAVSVIGSFISKDRIYLHFSKKGHLIFKSALFRQFDIFCKSTQFRKNVYKSMKKVSLKYTEFIAQLHDQC